MSDTKSKESFGFFFKRAIESCEVPEDVRCKPKSSYRANTMTNLEYIRGLNSEQLARLIWEEKPWFSYCISKADSLYEENDEVWNQACLDALVEWLNQVHE